MALSYDHQVVSQTRHQVSKGLPLPPYLGQAAFTYLQYHLLLAIPWLRNSCYYRIDSSRSLIFHKGSRLPISRVLLPPIAWLLKSAIVLA